MITQLETVYPAHLDTLLQYTKRHKRQTIEYRDYRNALLQEFPRATNDHTNAAIDAMVERGAIRRVKHGMFQAISAYFDPPPSKEVRDSMKGVLTAEQQKDALIRPHGGNTDALTNEELAELALELVKERPRSASEAAEFLEVDVREASKILCRLFRKGILDRVKGPPRKGIKGAYLVYIAKGAPKTETGNVQQATAPQKPEVTHAPPVVAQVPKAKVLVYTVEVRLPALDPAAISEVMAALGARTTAKVVDVKLEESGGNPKG